MPSTKSICIASAAAFAMALPVAPAYAADHDLSLTSESDLKSACDSQGGKFLSNGDVYGCSKACEGGTCHVICKKDVECFGVTPERRQPAPTGERGIIGALNASLVTQGDADGGAGADPDRDFPWGLLGLLGLAGLLGMRRRDDRPVASPRS